MPLMKRSTAKVILLCLLWYTISSLNNVVGKTLLVQFPYPMTVTFVQLLSITIYSAPVLQILNLKSNSIPKSMYMTIVIPLAVGKFVASVSSHVSIWKVPVSYAHTVKATMPLFTVVLSRVLFNERQTRRVYISLIPIITGVGIASVTEVSFDMIGLLAALGATCGFSLQNIFSKKLMKETGVHSFELLAILGRISMCMFLPFWVIVDVRSLMARHSIESSEIDWWTVSVLLVTDGILSFLQNIVAFGVLSMVTPLTYAVANASKRIAIIGVSLFLLRNPITLTNLMGMCMAVGGVLLYTRAKHKDGKSTLLPVHNDVMEEPTTAEYFITAAEDNKLILPPQCPQG